MNLLQKTKGFMKSLWKDEAGQGLVEYGLILALVAVGLIAILGTMSGSLDGLFSYISDQLTNSTTTPPPAAE
jgi:pilus assembly protein Flp/PilA